MVMSFRAVWALWLACVNMEVPAWTSTFHLARLVVSLATSTSAIRLMADWRFVWLVVSMELAKVSRLCSAPLFARIVAMFWIAAVMFARLRFARLPLTEEAVRAPTPAVESDRFWA